jgi:hypothetical protein
MIMMWIQLAVIMIIIIIIIIIIIHASHAECSQNMPINFADRRVVWRCTACEEEDGKTQCLYAKYEVTYKRKIIRTTTNKPQYTTRTKKKENNWEN